MSAFVLAVDLGSLSAAARSLSTTQPTVSKLIAALEASLGVRLLERSASQAQPTDEGLRFAESARRLLEDYDEAVATLDEGTRRPRGLVRVSAPVALGELHLNALMLRTLQLYPELQIDVVLSDGFVDPVEERFDLTVRIGGPLPNDLVARQLAAWPRYIVASPGYVERYGRPRSIEDLAHHPFLRYAAGSGETVSLHGPQEQTVDAPVSTRYRINHAAALLEAVRSGAGITFQPSWMVDGLIARKELVRLLPRWAGPPQTAWLLYPQRRRQPMRVRVMQDALTQAITAL